MMKRIYEATDSHDGVTKFSRTELAEILGVPQQEVRFTTPSGKSVQIFKVEVDGKTITFHAYN